MIRRLALSICVIIVLINLATAISSNAPPKIESITPSLQSPQSSGETITWTAEAGDPENDEIYFKFLLRGPRTGGNWETVQDWELSNSWVWDVEDIDTGSSDVSIWIKDEKHTYEMDDFKNYTNYIIIEGSESGLDEQPTENKSLFSDPNLEAAIRAAINKPEGAIYTTDLERLNSLDAKEKNIKNIIGLEHCSNLQKLQLDDNQITDVSPLSGLANLTHLELNGNQITDVSPLSELGKLEQLHLGSNQISDVSPLSGLTNLEWLALQENQIADVSSLSSLTSLEFLNLGNNQDGNQITDVSPLSGLTNLEWLLLNHNRITDVSPLSRLTNLKYLNLRGNPITDVSPLSGLTNLEIAQ